MVEKHINRDGNFYKIGKNGISQPKRRCVGYVAGSQPLMSNPNYWIYIVTVKPHYAVRNAGINP